MNRRDEYVTITAELKARTDRAVLLATEYGEGWVPRSCLHFLSDQAVDQAVLDDEIEVRVMEWIAEDRGLI